MSEFTTDFVVRSYELDALGHLNHAVFLNYFEQARFDALSDVGLEPAALVRQGWSVHVVRIEVDYRRPCHQGDRMVARTRIDQFRNSSMVILQSLEAEDGTVSAEARVTAVWIGKGGRPIRIPPEVRSALGSG